MKKSIIVLGAIATVLLMVSTVTAVSQTSSEPVMNTVKKMEALELFTNQLEDKLNDPPQPQGIISFFTGLIEIIDSLLEFFNKIAGPLADLIISILKPIKGMLESIVKILEVIVSILELIIP